MRATKRFILLTGLALVVAAAAAAQRRPAEQKAAFELFADRSAYAPAADGRIAAVVEVEPGWHVNSHQPTFDYLIPTELDLELPRGWSEPGISYPPGTLETFAFEEQPLSVYSGQVRIFARFRVPPGAAEGPYAVRARLRYQACNDRSCLPPTSLESEIGVTVGSGGSPANEEHFASAESPGPRQAFGPETGSPLALAGMLFLALLGGLILNAMPCVLPVLSLKVFGLVQSAGHGRTHVVRGSLATAGGILLSFWALALAAAVAKGMGRAVGWGIQFQNPGFVTFLAVVVVLFCLNLWGLLEINLPSRLATAVGSGQRQGLAGHFVSGLFATLMATPCSAPFLGTAVGFALSRSTAEIFAIFTAVGTGMALPYLGLVVAPGAARFLPRPGIWMEYVRILMGFLLAAAAIWLLYVLAAQVSARALALIELGLLLLTLGIWARQRLAHALVLQRLASLGVVAAAVGTIVFSLQAEAAGPDPGRGADGLIRWVEFDRRQARALSEQGRLVFVDVTADWCFTCKFNERLVLETDEVATAFERYGVIAMRADWTNRDDEIAHFLAEFGRSGIPFYLLYRPGAEPYVFSELISKGELLDVLRQIGRPAN